MTNEVEVIIPENVKTLSEAIAAGLSHSGEGILTVDMDVVTTAFEAVLPDGMTAKMAKQFKAVEKTAFAAVLNTVGESAVPIFTNDKEVAQVSATLPWFGDKMSATSHKEKEVRSPNGTTAMRSNYLSGSHKTQSTNSTGEVAKVKAHFKGLPNYK